ncbi:hypothetical protein, partial [Thalassospira profundimaris]|uniref:hypothetical protein n=1 Tax=Thalassospira profundimaris TaxID=502049 RepID=UPI001C687D4E
MQSQLINLTAFSRMAAAQMAKATPMNDQERKSQDGKWCPRARYAKPPELLGSRGFELVSPTGFEPV